MMESKMEKVDKVFQQWAFQKVRSSFSKGIKAVMREYEDSSLDKIWGLKPQYVGSVIRRRPSVAEAVA
jgi:hypothetical protein